MNLCLMFLEMLVIFFNLEKIKIILKENFLIRGEFTKGLLYIIDEFAFRLGAKSTDWVDLYFWIFFPEVFLIY